MQHPAPERLAAMASDIPSDEEARHLAACDACAREVQSFRTLGGMAARMSAVESARPVTEWSTLSARLHAEGLIRSSDAPHRGRSMRIWTMRLAAGLLLFIAGAVAGRAMAPLPQEGALTPLAAAGMEQFQSESHAREVLARAEREYQVAAAYLAAYAGGDPGDADNIRTRLATLDAVERVVRDAINDAPFDPVINQYYMGTLEARQATLHQLASALPPGMQLSSY